MRQLLPITMAAVAALVGCGTGPRVKSPTVATEPGSSPAGAAAQPAAPSDDERKEFVLNNSGPDKAAQAAKPSRIQSTKTEAAMRFIVIDKDKGPVEGVVIAVTAPDGSKYYTGETDAEGYAEVLVPVGQKYDLTYLSLGRRDIAASVSVTSAPKQNIKLTLRYKRYVPPPVPDAPATPRFVLGGVTFDTGKATIRSESFARLDSVVEYMTHKKSAHIEISGHTDNVGNAKTNKALSQKRAQACRDYLISKGIDGGRIKAIGHGDERPIAPNDTDDGRQTNRRIEATEL